MVYNDGMRVLLSSIRKDLHEFLEMPNPPEVIRLPLMAKPDAAEGYHTGYFTAKELEGMIHTKRMIIFTKLGILDGVAIYVEEEAEAKQS